MNLKKIILIFFVTFLYFPFVRAVPDKVIFSGCVRDTLTKELLEFATIQLKGKNTFSGLSDKNGNFKFSSVLPGEYVLQVSYLGYVSWQKKIELKSDLFLQINMTARSNKLKEVVITAAESPGIVSSSKIDRAAMAHLQPTSFADLLELLPGNISQTPNMGVANTITLRETGTLNASGEKSDNPDYSISSLGTLFLVDGAPINGDASMQYIPSGSDSSSPEYKRNITNKGVDMRSISTDDIESVEIVRGIPSAEYGNLTSGLVNIKRIRKSTPFTARFKADEYSKLFSVGKGFAVPGQDLILNIDGGYLDSKVDPRNNLENYKRINASVRSTWNLKKEMWNMGWNSGVDYTGSFDNVKTDPDLSYQKIDKYKSTYNRTAFTNNFSWTFPKVDLIKSIELNSSVSIQSDRLKRTKLMSPQRATVAPTSMEEGVHDGTYLLGQYVADYLSEGKPLNAFLKMKGELEFFLGKVKNSMKAGGEWNYSKNRGRGQVYDISHPIVTSGWTTRPRAYKDIPALQNLSFFLEDNITARMGKHKWETLAGVRSISLVGMSPAYLLQGKIYLDPRINSRWSFPAIRLGSHNLNIDISGGYGLTTKMPTIDYLYPNKWYNDIIQLNYYDVNKPLEYSRINVRTYIKDITNYRLEPSRNRKWEVRSDISYNGNRLSVTYFRERLTSGFRYSSYYMPFEYRKYDASSIDAGSLQGPPALEDISYTDTRKLDGYMQAANGSRLEKEGVEFQFTSQRIRPLRTSVIINGAWFKSTYTNSQPMFETVSEVVDNRPIQEEYVGLYDWNSGRINQQFNTNFMLDTQIPEWGLIFSTSVQCMWFVSTQRMYQNGVPVSYLDVNDGLLHPYTQESAEDMKLQFLVKTYNADSFKKQTVPMAMYVNFKATKQIGKYLKLALFANRILDYLPDYTSNGLRIRRNVNPYFGMELNFSL